MNFRKTALLLLVLPALQKAGATTRTVSSLNDSGAGSLRDTIAASAANDTINLAVNGTITLTSGELLIGRNLIIAGPGATFLTVSGNNASHVFNISYGIGVNISNLSISNGRGNQTDAGGINNNGTLTLNNCTLSSNQADSRGGGIYNGGFVTMNNCTIVNNSAGWHGGGIYNGGTLVIRNCTLSGNTCVGGNGGGIFINVNGTLTLNNCTFSGNKAEILGGVGGVGGGIFNDDGSLTILNTIVAGNLANFEDPDVSGTVNSQGDNLIGKIGSSSGWVVHGGGGQVVKPDLIGTAAAPLDPLLGPLQYNSGPTLTIVPLPGSAAIDAGDDSILSTLATDQRGRPRKIGTHVDIGAVEVGSVTFVVSNANDSGSASLRQAILDSSPVEADRITFAPNVTGVITLTSGELLIGKGVGIYGPGANVLTISGNNASRVFHVTSAGGVIDDLRIANGRTSAGGGGILIENSDLNVDYCTIAGCYAQGADAAETGGGGIAVVGSSHLRMSSSTLSSNTTPFYGGGIYAFNGASALAFNSTISGNRTLDGSSGEAWGGGVYAANGSILTISGSTIASNSSASAGGGIYKGFNGTVTVANSLIAGNSAPGAPDCKGTFVSSGYNLIGNSSGSTGFGVPGDQLNVNPLLGPLADNGGPTFTHALLTGSPAIDKGKSFGVITTDQRGHFRPYDFTSIPNASGGDGSDIGAFEVSPPVLSIVRAGSKVVVSWPAGDTGYTLEGKPNLSPSTAWAAVPGTVVVGSQNTLTVAAPTGNKLYRLRSP